MNRRDLLKRTGTGLAVGAGLWTVSGSASAADTSQFSRRVESETVRATMAGRESVLSELSDAGVIDVPDAGALDVDEGYVTATKGAGRGLPVVLGVVPREGGRLVVGAVPDADDGFALFERSDGEVERFGTATATSCGPCEDRLCYCSDWNCGCPIEPGCCCEGTIDCFCVPSCECGGPCPK